MKSSLNNPAAFDKWMEDEEIKPKEPSTQEDMKKESTSQSSRRPYVRLITFYLIIYYFPPPGKIKYSSRLNLPFLGHYGTREIPIGMQAPRQPIYYNNYPYSKGSYNNPYSNSSHYTNQPNSPTEYQPYLEKGLTISKTDTISQ